MATHQGPTPQKALALESGLDDYDGNDDGGDGDDGDDDRDTVDDKTTCQVQLCEALNSCCCRCGALAWAVPLLPHITTRADSNAQNIQVGS